MPGVTTAYQTGIHSARPASSAGCILYSCTTHGLVYRSDGSTWTTFLTISAGSSSATPALTFGTAAAAGSAGTFVATDATLPIFDATAPSTQAFSDAAAAGAAGVAARRDHKHGMPASPGGGGGGLVLLESHVASSSAILAFTTRNAAGQSGATFQSDFDDYLIKIVNLGPTTDGAELRMRLSTNGGSSYDTSNIYEWRSSRWSNAGDGAAGSNTQDYFVLDHQSGGVDNAHGGVSGSYNLFDPLSASSYKAFMGQATLSNNFDNHLELAVMGGRYASATAVNAFEIYYSTGNLASGAVYLYGLAKT